MTNFECIRELYAFMCQARRKERERKEVDDDDFLIARNTPSRSLSHRRKSLNNTRDLRVSSLRESISDGSRPRGRASRRQNRPRHRRSHCSVINVRPTVVWHQCAQPVKGALRALPTQSAHWEYCRLIHESFSLVVGATTKHNTNESHAVLQRTSNGCLQARQQV